LKRFLKFILPGGIVDLVKNRRKLREIGRRLSPTELFKSDRMVLDAECSGLSLFAPGHVGKFRNVVDVGANTGQWSGMLLNCVTPEKFGNNRLVELHNVAIGERESIERLKITRDTTGASLLQPRDEMRAVIGSNWTITSEVEVPMTTLDRLLVDLPEVSLLKIDVQGYEKSVFAGAKQTLAKTKFLLVELNFMPQYDGGSWFGDVHQILTRDFGFFLANASRPQVLNGRASMCDGLYVNPNLVREWVKPDFV
jgi:FkbM family methyltransferase